MTLFTRLIGLIDYGGEFDMMQVLKDCKHMSNVLFTIHSQFDDLINLSSLIHGEEDSSDDIIILKVIE